MQQIGNFGGGATAKETIAKVKSTRETVTSNTTLQDDNNFVFPVKANKTYAIIANLYVSAPSTGGFKWAFSVPSGTTGRANQSRSVGWAGTVDTDITAGYGSSTGLSISGEGTDLRFTGVITTSSTAGNITFQWAQNASNVTGTYIERGSTMTLIEV